MTKGILNYIQAKIYYTNAPNTKTNGPDRMLNG